MSGLRLGIQHLYPLGRLNQRLHHFEAPSLSSASLMTSLYKIHTRFVFYEIFSFFILALYIFMHKMLVLIVGSIFYSVGLQCCTQNLNSLPPTPDHQETGSDAKAKSLFITSWNSGLLFIQRSSGGAKEIPAALDQGMYSEYSMGGVGEVRGARESAGCIVANSGLMYLRAGGTCPELIG